MVNDYPPKKLTNMFKSMLGNYGTMAVNINDFARYARNTRMIFVQILVIPLSFMLMAFMGIIIAGAASDLYGESIWDPLTVMAHWDGSHGARAASAFLSLSFVLGQLGSNLSANCVSASNDLNAMFPSVSVPHEVHTISTNQT
jgi:NCS1 family nucleobase:cation symporter-1